MPRYGAREKRGKVLNLIYWFCVIYTHEWLYWVDMRDGKKEN